MSPRTPPYDPETAIPDMAMSRLDAERYHSADYMAAEWSGMWRRVWNMACRSSELSEPGDYFVYHLGQESFVFVRGEDDKLRGFYNVCQHRGNQLAQGGEGPAYAPHFTCSYHGWQWSLDGAIRHIPDLETFPQFGGCLPSGEVDLSPVTVDEWGGWVWFNMDPDCASLLDYLSPIPEHLAPYELDNWVIIEHKTFEWPCNWKVACDAFNESYHFADTHPQMMQWSNGRADVELLGIHSRMINEYGTVDPRFENQESLNPSLRRLMENVYQIDPDTFEGKPKDVRLAVQARKRAMQDDTFLPYRNLRDEQLSDTFHYTIFPNVSWNLTSESIIGFRYRPHERDPQRSYFDLMIMRCQDPNRPTPDYEHEWIALADLPDRYGDALDINALPEVIDPLDQDARTTTSVQRGVVSAGFKGVVLGHQEARVRHLHNVIDDYINGKR